MRPRRREVCSQNDSNEMPLSGIQGCHERWTCLDSSCKQMPVVRQSSGERGSVKERICRLPLRELQTCLESIDLPPVRDDLFLLLREAEWCRHYVCGDQLETSRCCVKHYAHSCAEGKTYREPLRLLASSSRESEGLKSSRMSTRVKSAQ